MRRLWDGNVTVSASVLMIQPTTSSFVSQSANFYGQEGRIGDTTFAQQAKKVRCKRLDNAQTTATVRPPLQLNENVIVYLIPHK